MTGQNIVSSEGDVGYSALLTLPPEILLKILVEFDLKARDLANIDRTCHRFSSCSEDGCSLTEDAARLIVLRLKKPFCKYFSPGLRGSTWKECLHLIESHEKQLSKVASGSFQNVLCTPEKRVLTWGAGALGQLGTGRLEDSPQVHDITHLIPRHAGPTSQVSAGSAHIAVVTTNGSVFVCGDGRYGQLGTGATQMERLPRQVMAGVPIMQVACGSSHSVFLSYQGTAYSVGCGKSGQLGLGQRTRFLPEPTAVPIENDDRVSQVSVGVAFSVFVTEHGKIFTCGKSACGQLGHGGTKDLYTPTLIVTLMDKTIVYAAAGVNHTLCVDSEGGVYSFGNGDRGQLGHGEFRSELVPRRVEALDMFDIRISSVAAGDYRSIFVARNGIAYWCGVEIGGEPSEEKFQANLPTCIHLDERVKHASVGDTHAVLVTRSGRVMTAGRNGRGQAGFKHGPANRFLPICLDANISDPNP